MRGRVVLVGAGPGDPDLLTVRAARELERADVVLYDALIEPGILDLVREGAERIDVGKRGDGSRGVPQEEIASLLIEKARAGHYVVRLKGGDPFVFGRGGEEASALREAGVPFEVVPGISSAIAVPAYAGIPVTDRRWSSSIAIVTGHRGQDPVDRRVDWEGLAGSAETLVILMGTAWLEDIVARVIAGGRDPDTPAAVIASGSTARQRVVTAPLHELALRTREAGLSAPTIVVVGEVTRFREKLAWFERRPLFGRRVLVPRAAGQQGTLAIELQRRGAEPVRVALLEFREPEDVRGLEEATANAGRYDWIVFTSANAVRFCQPYLGSAATLGDARVACIGQATAAAAARAGLPVHVVPPERSLPGELAAAMQARSPLRDASVLFPQASRAREELPRILEAAGAKVDAVEAYRTALPEAAAREVGAALREGLEAVTLTSPSTADHFFACLEAEELAPLARELVFACIGPSTAAALERHGVVPHAVAERQTSEALAEALEAVFAESGRDVS